MANFILTFIEILFIIGINVSVSSQLLRRSQAHVMCMFQCKKYPPPRLLFAVTYGQVLPDVLWLRELGLCVAITVEDSQLETTF